MSSWATSVKIIERREFEYFQSLLGGDYNVNAFIGKHPRSFKYTGEKGLWTFALLGGNQPLDMDFNMNDAGCCIDVQMDAMLEGVWADRDDAWQAAGIIRNNLPIAELTQIEGVRRLRIVQNPQVDPDVIEREEDLALGGEMEVWRLTVGLSTLFQQVDA